MEYKNIPDLKIENAELVFAPNFAGDDPKGYNRQHLPQFNVRIPDAIADDLIADGWPVQVWPREPDDEQEQIYHLLITVRYDGYQPPTVYLVASNGQKTRIEDDEHFKKLMPGTKFKNIDLVIHPYQWEVNGKSGVKAYLGLGYFVVDSDPFEAKYATEESPEELPF